MVTIPKSSNIKDRQLTVTSAPIIQGRDDGAGLVEKSISELAGTTHDIFKDSVEKLNIGKDNAYISEKLAETNKYSIQLLEEDKVNYNEGLDGYAEGTQKKIKAYQEKILAEAPNDIIRNKLKQNFSAQSTSFFNDAYNEEVASSSIHLYERKNKTLKDLEGQVMLYYRTNGNMAGGHILKMQGRDLITKGEHVIANSKSVVNDLKKWNLRYTTAMLLGIAQRTEYKTTIEIKPKLLEHIETNKEEFIELLGGVVEYETLVADVFQLFPKEINDQFETNTKIFEMENEYEGDVFIDVTENIEDYYEKKNGNLTTTEDNSYKISDSGRKELERITAGLDPYNKQAIIKYVDESVVKKNLEVVDNPYAIDYINEQIANKSDPRQELNYYYVTDQISRDTYESYTKDHNKISDGDWEQYDLMSAVTSHSNQIKDFKRLYNWSETQKGDIVEKWKKHIRKNPKKYKGNLEGLEEDWHIFLKNEGISQVEIYITKNQGPDFLEGSVADAVSDHKGVAINQLILTTIDKAPAGDEERRVYFLDKSENIQEIINNWKTHHMKDGEMPAFPFHNQTEMLLQKMKDQEEIEKKDKFERIKGSQEKKQDLENIILDDVLDIIEDYTDSFINDPTVFTDPNRDPLRSEGIDATVDKIYEKYEAIAEEQNISVPLSKSRIKKYIIEASLKFPSKGTSGHMSLLLDYTKAKPLDKYDLTFKHIRDNTIRKKLIEAAERQKK